MGAVEQDGTPPKPSVTTQASSRDELRLQLHTDEAVWMRQIGHLKDWCSQTSSVQLGIPTRVATPLAANSLRLLWIFQNLQHLNITFNSTRSRIEQPIVVACAELLNLTSLQLVGGHLTRHGLDLGVLTSLRRLWSLAVRPHSDDELDGLEDEHLAGAARLTGLKSLSLRASENVTDEGVMALTALTGLTQLSLVPMGLCVTREGVSALSAAMPFLGALAVGLHESRQVAALKGLQERPRQPPIASPASTTSKSSSLSFTPAAAAAAAATGALPPPSPPTAISLVLNSPEVSTSGFFSTLTLVLRPQLVSLRMATVESTDPSFLLAVGTLQQLTELKMGVSMPEGGQPFTCNLAALSSLGKLHTLEFAVTQELRLPLSVKMVSLLAMSWPRLRSLGLSAMAKPEVVPEALGLLDNFSGITSLSLFAPLDFCSDDEPSVLELPINPRYLPPGLNQLVLECAHLELNDSTQRSRRDYHTTAGLGLHPTQPQTQAQSQPQLESQLQPSYRERCEAQAPQGYGRGSSSGGVIGTHASVLPLLEHLELNSCRVSDESLGSVLASATGLRHLELTDVKGVSDSDLSALHGLTRLEHLVVRLPGNPHARLGGAMEGGVSGGVSHHSLAALRHASMLRHLEWSLAEPLGASDVEAALSGMVSALGGLQELYLDVAPELRSSSGNRRELEERSGSGVGYGVSAKNAGGPAAGNGITSGSGWLERLQLALPLCTVSARPGLVLYDLWNDRTVQVVEP